MNNKEKAEDWLDTAKAEMNTSDRNFNKYIQIAQVHATLALEEAVRSMDNEVH